MLVRGALGAASPRDIWRKIEPEASGADGAYYHNEATGVSRWDRPPMPPPAPLSVPPPDLSSLATAWQSHADQPAIRPRAKAPPSPRDLPPLVAPPPAFPFLSSRSRAMGLRLTAAEDRSATPHGKSPRAPSTSRAHSGDAVCPWGEEDAVADMRYSPRWAGPRNGVRLSTPPTGQSPRRAGGGAEVGSPGGVSAAPAETDEGGEPCSPSLLAPALSPSRCAAAGGAGHAEVCEDVKRTSCKGLVTPAVLMERYSIPSDSAASARTDAMSSMSVAEFDPTFSHRQHFDPKDIAGFSAACHVNATVDNVVGGDDPPRPGDEAELDIEYIKGVAQHVPLTVIYAEGYSLLNWANNVTSMADPPLVHSVSYGNDEKQQSGAAYMDAVNIALMKAGARGLSILFASGDEGVCGREGCGLIKRRFKPWFPDGSPYLTSVGGTDFATDSTGEEAVWPSGGGGFSDHFP